MHQSLCFNNKVHFLLKWFALIEVCNAHPGTLSVYWFINVVFAHSMFTIIWKTHTIHSITFILKSQLINHKKNVVYYDMYNRKWHHTHEIRTAPSLHVLFNTYRKSSHYFWFWTLHTFAWQRIFSICQLYHHKFCLFVDTAACVLWGSSKVGAWKIKPDKDKLYVRTKFEQLNTPCVFPAGSNRCLQFEIKVFQALWIISSLYFKRRRTENIFQDYWWVRDYNCMFFFSLVPDLLMCCTLLQPRLSKQYHLLLICINWLSKNELG